MSSTGHYFSILNGKKGREVGRLTANVGGTIGGTGDTLSLKVSNGSNDDRLKIEAGPNTSRNGNSHYMLFKDGQQEVSDVFLPPEFSLTPDGTLLFTGGSGVTANGFTVTASPSGNVFSNILTFQVDESTGLQVSNVAFPTGGGVTLTYSNNIIVANTFIGANAYIGNLFANNLTANTAYIEDLFANVIVANTSFIADGHFTNVYTNVLTDNGTSNITITTESTDFFGNVTSSIIPPDRIPANTFIPGLGTKIDIAGVGVSQFLPADPNRSLQLQPILPTNQLTTAGPPYGLSNVYSNLPLYETDGYQDPLNPTNYINSIEPKALLNFYGDSGGGDEPQPAAAGYAAMRWYTINPNSAVKKYLQAQRNFHYSPTFIETSTGAPSQLLPSDTIPDFPFLSNVLEMRNYTGANVYAESYIGIRKKPTPISDDPDSNRWEWKVHDDYDIDMLPVYYGDGTLTGPASGTVTANVINEVNKISHVITPGSKTQIKLATNYTSGAGDGDGHVMIEFDPSTNTINDATKMPTGLSTFYQEGKQIWQTDATEFNVQLTEEATSTTDAALVTKGGLGVVKQSHFGDRLWLNSNTVDNGTIVFRPFDQGIGAAEIQYDTSNVLHIMAPDLSTIPGTRQLRDRITISESDIHIGNNDPALDTIRMSIKDRDDALKIVSDSVQINPDLDGVDFEVFSDNFGAGAKALFNINASASTSTVNTNFRYKNPAMSSVGNAISFTDYPTYSEIVYNQGGLGQQSVKFYSDGLGLLPNFNIDKLNQILVLENSDTSNPLFKIYSNNAVGNTFEALTIQGNGIEIGDNARVYVDNRSRVDFANSGEAICETFNVKAPSAISQTALSVRTTNNNTSTNNYVEINPGKYGNIGFKVNTDNYSNAMVMGSEYDDMLKMGVPIVAVSNTTSNHISESYATPHGLVYSSDEDRYCYYTDDASELKCLATTTDLFKTAYEVVTYRSYADLNSNLNTSNVGYFAYIDLALNPQRSVESNKPRVEPLAPADSNVTAPVTTLGDSYIRSLLPIERIMGRFVFRNSRFTIGTNYGPDNVDTDYPEIGTFNDWMIVQGVDPLIGPQRRCFFDIKFFYDSAFDDTTSMFSDGKEDEIINGDSCRAFANEDGWITGVEVHAHSNIYIQPGDTTWDGSVDPFRPFLAFYLSDDMRRSGSGDSDSVLQNPTGVVKYLQTFQFVSNATTTTGAYLPNPIIMPLNTEDWVYVARGDPLPFVSMVCKMGMENGVFGIESADQDADYACPYLTCIVHWAPKPARVGVSTGDKRWELE